jgi:Mg2+-importing ATPase
LIFSGFTAFFDPPRAEAGEAVAALAAAGIAVKIITGDHDGVARHVCRETGITVTGALDGTQIAALDDHALAAQLETVNLVCRVSPDQKSRVITLLRRHGHAAGFMGDGINDAPALRAADVGISVDTGVDVVKEAAA